MELKKDTHNDQLKIKLHFEATSKIMLEIEQLSGVP